MIYKHRNEPRPTFDIPKSSSARSRPHQSFPPPPGGDVKNTATHPPHAVARNENEDAVRFGGGSGVPATVQNEYVTTEGGFSSASPAYTPKPKYGEHTVDSTTRDHTDKDKHHRGALDN